MSLIKTRAPSSLEQMPPEKTNAQEQKCTDEELRSQKKGLTGRRAAKTLNSIIWMPLVLVMFSPASMATNGN